MTSSSSKKLPNPPSSSSNLSNANETAAFGSLSSSQVLIFHRDPCMAALVSRTILTTSLPQLTSEKLGPKSPLPHRKDRASSSLPPTCESHPCSGNEYHSTKLVPGRVRDPSTVSRVASRTGFRISHFQTQNVARINKECFV